MHAYQDAAGGWIVFDGTTKHRFATQAEAKQYIGEQERMAQEAQLLKNLQATAADMVNVAAGARAQLLEASLLYTDANGDIVFSADALAEAGITQAEATAALGAINTLLSLTTEQQRALLVFRRAAS